MTTTIKLRGGTAAEWAAADPVLAAREVGLDLTNLNFRVGDGASAWSALANWIVAGGGGASGLSVAVLQDQKPAGTNGGTFTAGAWRTRDINTIVSDPDNLIVSLSSNQFVLANGDYLIIAMLPSHMVNRSRGQIFDATNNTTLAISATSYGRSTYGGVDYCYPFCRFSSTGQSLELHHRCDNTNLTNGFGLNSASQLSISDVEVFSVLLVVKL